MTLPRSRTGTTQRANIKKFLEDGFSLTALEALSLFGAYRLAAHIEVLRNKHGMPIVTSMCVDVTGRTYARYKLNTTDAVFLRTFGKELIALATTPHPFSSSRQKEINYHA